MVRTRKAFLPIGYGVIITLLVLASTEAYSTQRGISERHFDTYRRHIKQDELLSELRRTIWVAGGQVRDFFLDVRAERATILQQNLGQLRSQCDHALEGLDQLDHKWGTPGVRHAIAAFWKTLEPVPETMAGARKQQQFEFVQREVIPRRSSLYAALGELAQADRDALQDNEAEFVLARKNAANRL